MYTLLIFLKKLVLSFWSPLTADDDLLYEHLLTLTWGFAPNSMGGKRVVDFTSLLSRSGGPDWL